MPYVQRDDNQKVVGLFAKSQTGYAEEFLADDDKEVLEYLNPTPTAEEVAERERQEAIKGDSGLQDMLAKFRSMSPTDFASYIENNVTNLASAKVVLVRMGLMLMLLDRKTGKGQSD